MTVGIGANQRWNRSINVGHISKKFEKDRDTRAAAKALAENLNAFVIKRLDRKAEHLASLGHVYDEDVEYTNIVWEADQWREIIEELTDYANDEEWVEEDDFDCIISAMYDLADRVGLWIDQSR